LFFFTFSTVYYLRQEVIINIQKDAQGCYKFEIISVTKFQHAEEKKHEVWKITTFNLRKNSNNSMV